MHSGSRAGARAYGCAVAGLFEASTLEPGQDQCGHGRHGMLALLLGHRYDLGLGQRQDRKPGPARACLLVGERHTIQRGGRPRGSYGKVES